MLEYWMANNDSATNGSEFEIKEVLEDPGSAILFVGYPPWLLYFAAGCCVLFMLIGIPGNLITVAALFRTKKLRNATAVFIMNLAVSDLMFCCFNLPLATSTFWQSSWLHGPLLCRLFPLLRYGLVAVSLFTVLAITINRYVMIGHPRLYPKVYKPKYLVLMVLATWISGFGALVATWFGKWGRFGLDPVIGSCSILPDVNGRSPKEFLFILAFLTPCIAIIVCYARIFYIVRKTALKSRRREKVTTDLVKTNIEIKYTKNFEDSAIGSSCGATLTTTENGGSPNKYHQKRSFNSLSSTNIANAYYENVCTAREDDQMIQRASKMLSSLDNSKSEERLAKCFTSGDTRSLNEAVNSENNTESERINDVSIDNIEISSSTFANESLCFTDDFRNKKIDDENYRRLNFERSVEFMPFIDTCIEQQITSTKIDNFEIVNARSIPNLRFSEADSNSEKSIAECRMTKDKSRNECCLKVPRKNLRSQYERESSRSRQILDTQSLENDEKFNIPRIKKFIDSDDGNFNGHLNPRSVKPARYNTELSDEYESSRSVSPTGKRESTRKCSIFRRESRFRSVRNRAFESGKMTPKDKKLLKMILVIFSSFLICYLPITITKTFKDMIDWRGLNIAGYILIYLTTCINPVIYVVMSSEYRCAYKNVLLCRSDSSALNCKQTIGNVAARAHERRKNRERRESIN